MKPVSPLTKDELINLLRRSGTGFRTRDSEFFIPGDKLIGPDRRFGVVSAPRDEDAGTHDKLSETFCNVPGCNSLFASVGEFESHYNSLHRFNCAQCKKNLPSAHLLDLHLEETHDSYFEMLSQRKPSFRCFLEECKEKFPSPAERRDHGISVHKLPSNFKFATKDKKRTTKGVETEPMEDDQTEVKGAQPEVLKKSAVIKQKPITFGHNVPRSFDSSYAKALTKKEKKDKKNPANPLEDHKMVVDLLESLPQ